MQRLLLKSQKRTLMIPNQMRILSRHKNNNLRTSFPRAALYRSLNQSVWKTLVVATISAILCQSVFAREDLVINSRNSEPVNDDIKRRQEIGESKDKVVLMLEDKRLNTRSQAFCKVRGHSACFGFQLRY